MVNGLTLIKNKIKYIKDKGFFDIVVSTTLTKALMFLSAIFLPRFLTVNDYAELTYAETMLSYLLLLSGMGLSQATLKYCVNVDDKKKKGLLIKTTSIGLGFNVLVLLVACIVVNFIDVPFEQSKHLFVMMLGIPFFSHLFQNFQCYLRADFENRKYAILSIVYTVLLVVLQILFAVQSGSKGVVYARYISYIACTIIAFFMLYNLKNVKACAITRQEIRSIIIFAVAILIGNFFSTALVNNEMLFVSNFFNDKLLTSNFKVASYFLQICIFITEAIMIFVLPYFAKNINDRSWTWNTFKKLFFYNAVGMTIIILAIALISKRLVFFIWGEQYIGAVTYIKVILLTAWSTTVLRAIPGNVLAFVGGEKYTLIINLVTCIIHIGVDYMLFKYIGANAIGFGLALAYAISGLAMIFTLRGICKKGGTI